MNQIVFILLVTLVSHQAEAGTRCYIGQWACSASCKVVGHTSGICDGEGECNCSEKSIRGFQLHVEGQKSNKAIRTFRQSWRANVPELPSVPDFPAAITYENRTLEPNDSINTEQCMGRPWIKWSPTISGNYREPMYTVFLLDVSIRRNQTFIHWIKTNVIGTDTNTGDESMEYSPTFAFRSCSNGTTNHGDPCPPEDENKIVSVPGYSHVMAVMILRQETGRIFLKESEKQVGCNGPMLSNRLQPFSWIDNFTSNHNLKLEAGTFFRNPYTRFVDKLICRLTSCTSKERNETFPDHIVKGVNDLPECAPFKGDPTAEVDWLALLDKSPGNCIEHGVQMVWKNGYLDQFDINMSPEECRRKCNQRSECAAWTTNKSNGWCALLRENQIKPIQVDTRSFASGYC